MDKREQFLEKLLIKVRKVLTGVAPNDFNIIKKPGKIEFIPKIDFDKLEDYTFYPLTRREIKKYISEYLLTHDSYPPNTHDLDWKLRRAPILGYSVIYYGDRGNWSKWYLRKSKAIDKFIQQEYEDIIFFVFKTL